MGRQSLLIAIIINQPDVRVCVLDRDSMCVCFYAGVRESLRRGPTCNFVQDNIFCKDMQIQHNNVRLYDGYNVFVVNTLLLYHCCKITPNATLPCSKSTQCV